MHTCIRFKSQVKSLDKSIIIIQLYIRLDQVLFYVITYLFLKVYILTSGNIKHIQNLFSLTVTTYYVV